MRALRTASGEHIVPSCASENKVFMCPKERSSQVQILPRSCIPAMTPRHSCDQQPHQAGSEGTKGLLTRIALDVLTRNCCRARNNRSVHVTLTSCSLQRFRSSSSCCPGCAPWSFPLNPRGDKSTGTPQSWPGAPALVPPNCLINFS